MYKYNLEMTTTKVTFAYYQCKITVSIITYSIPEHDVHTKQPTVILM